MSDNNEEKIALHNFTSRSTIGTDQKLQTTCEILYSMFMCYVGSAEWH